VLVLKLKTAPREILRRRYRHVGRLHGVNAGRIRANRPCLRNGALDRQDYNYFRDYEPGTGRYVESDPVGLSGGISTCAYVRSNPQLLFDSFGLEASYSGFNKDDEKAMRDANATAIRVLQSCNCRDCKEIGNDTNCIDELKKHEIIAELQFASYRYTPPNPAHPTYCAETQGKNSQIHPSALGTPPACCPLPAILADEAGHAIHLSRNHVAINWYLANCFHCGK
jgi:RHS repeat-associated protein